MANQPLPLSTFYSHGMTRYKCQKQFTKSFFSLKILLYLKGYCKSKEIWWMLLYCIIRKTSQCPYKKQRSMFLSLTSKWVVSFLKSGDRDVIVANHLIVVILKPLIKPTNQGLIVYNKIKTTDVLEQEKFWHIIGHWVFTYFLQMSTKYNVLVKLYGDVSMDYKLSY